MTAPVSRRRRAQRGTVLVEGALILLVFFGVLIGTFDFGQFLYIHQALVDRTRSAARWALVNSPVTNAQIQNMVIYNQTTAGTNPFLNLTSANVTVTQPNAGSYNACVSILISGYQYVMLSPYIGGTYTGPNISVTVPLGYYD